MNLSKINKDEKFRYRIEKEDHEKFSAQVTLGGHFVYGRYDLKTYDAAVDWVVETYDREVGVCGE